MTAKKKSPKTTKKKSKSTKDKDDSVSLDEQLKHEKDKNLRLFAEFDNFRKRTAKERIELFRKAKIVVAPHGGANYHIYFSSKYTKFIEFIFVKDCHSCQLQALSFDLDYWQIPISDHGQFEKIITIDTNALNSLREILEK